MMLLPKLILTMLRKYQLKLLSRNTNTKIGKSLKIGDYCNFSLYPNLEEITLGNNINIRNYCNILVGKNAKLSIGDRFFMNNYCSINAIEKIEIGENTLFGEGVKLYDHNHEYSQHKVEHQKFKSAPIKIGKNCWLGSNVTVLKGVTIGDNCIVGAGCVVYKDLPERSVIISQQELIIKDISNS